MLTLNNMFEQTQIEILEDELLEYCDRAGIDFDDDDELRAIPQQDLVKIGIDPTIVDYVIQSRKIGQIINKIYPNNTPQGTTIPANVIQQVAQQLGINPNNLHPNVLKPVGLGGGSGNVPTTPHIAPQSTSTTPTPINATEEERLKAYTKILEFITNTFYKTNDNDEILIEINNSPKNKTQNYWDSKRISLSRGLMDAFADLNLPRFLIYYHELGHHLYSNGLSVMDEAWRKEPVGSPIEYNKKYLHLMNWIEDFFIEDTLLKEHPYLTDVVTCIKKLPIDYDIKAIEYAFNYWYMYQTPTPALPYIDQVTFKSYITRLLTLRASSTGRFGHGVVSTLSIKPSKETQYIKLLIEFHAWCVSKNILPDAQLPSLQNPNNHLEQEKPAPTKQSGSQPSSGQTDPGNSSDPSNSSDPGALKNKGGTSSPHSQQVGKSPKKYVEAPPIKTPTNAFQLDVDQENKMIYKELLDMSQRLQTDTSTLDGLFNLKYKESSIIQPKIVLPNFFNPNRIVDQVLFHEKQHTYMNVALIRDISGSTEGDIHTLMHHICERLYQEIPVDVTYYLYSSGKISIIEVPYVPWEDSNKVPKTYEQNPLFKQLSGGTNSDAIADVITQQLSEKWLNIVITDGDLNSLMARDNIKELLKNVFVVSVGEDLPFKDLLHINIKDKTQIDNIIPVLSTINLH